MTMMSRLVLLTGPVGGGKTTTSLAVGARLRAHGLTTVVVDLDDMYRMVRQDEPMYTDMATWRLAYRSAAAIANACFTSGVAVVIVEGSFTNEEELGWLTDHVRTPCETVVVALDLSWEQTLRRVETDPSSDRVASRDPSTLRWLYEQFEKGRPF